jgi:F-type H+-transporting ATPase subunit b
MVVFIALAESIQLVPDGTLFLHIAIIIVMVFILNKTLFKPINRILSERDSRTHGSSAEAQGILRRVDESLADYERILREARTESYQMLEAQRTEAVLGRQQKLGSVREEIEHLIDEEKSAVRAQVSGVRAELDVEVQRVAANIRNHILGRPMQ